MMRAVMRAASLGSWVLVSWSLLGCQQPPPGKVYVDEDPRAAKPTKDPEFTATAHREAYAQLTTDAIEPLRRADPIAGALLGKGPLAPAPLALIDRNGTADALAPVWASVGEIDEAALQPAEVVGIRALRFGLGRVNDELHRRPSLRVDPLTSVRAIERLVDEIELRLGWAECPECDASLANLGDNLTSAHQQLAASSLASAREASRRARALAERLRGLARVQAAHAPAFESAAAALEAHAGTLDRLVDHLPSATTIEWSTQAPPVVGGLESVQRLPPAIGERALTRLLSAEERIDTPVGRLWSQTKQHAGRWQRMREQLVEPTLAAEPAAAPLDLARCEATRARIVAGLAGVPEVEPPKLDCTRWLALQGEVSLRESELVVGLLDAGWIEPQRRAIRSAELPAIALISGQWSAEVHLHLRRVMLLAALDEPHARALALDEGRRALCLAGAALWIHGQLGPVDEVRLMMGNECALLLPDAAALEAIVVADPRGALAGLGLSQIGDEPAAMAGFDRFWWAPLGLMRLLATPPGMHPDAFELPSEKAAESDAGEIEVKIEPLDPLELPEE